MSESSTQKRRQTRGNKDSSERLDQEAWVRAALRALQDEGVEKVRVEPLAKKLGVTKGSFYWHFKDRQDLLDKMLTYWFERMTKTVFEAANRFQGEPTERLIAVLEDIIGEDRAGYDLAVRAWARTEPAAAEAVRNVDQQRYEFMVSLFGDIGFNAEDAELRGRITYNFILGDAIAFNREAREAAIQAAREKVRLLVGEPRGSL